MLDYRGVRLAKFHCRYVSTKRPEYQHRDVEKGISDGAS